MTYTPAQFAKDVQVGRSKVMTWIKSGELAAINVSDSDTPRYRITDEAVAAFFDSRRVKTSAAIERSRRITQRTTKDYFA